ncbi:MAG: CDP-glucose 4,6-dehydratase [Oscillospiraceae bacterium]|jgi:CDP-glucose 4,6-dehydratase|nr:CDP-glucose 4,6-dehydratase [Oscillospiraceae bacterium]
METMEINFQQMFDGTFKDKNVLVTGHTGFKGSWLSLWLHLAGAHVTGYALPPYSEHDNYVLSHLDDKITDIRGDVRDFDELKKAFDASRPEIVFHLAAQPLVRRSYENPHETFDTNIRGTLNVLELIRKSPSVKAAVVITSDKCYENKEQIWSYRECDRLGGHDPYSASKACAEIVTQSYIQSLFSPDSGKYVATARAGNVIGGGDWSEDRLIPDIIRSLEADKAIVLRNPNSTRPWQHVLEPLYGYLLLASKLFHQGSKYCGAWNFGPDFGSISTVHNVTTKMIALWGSGKIQIDSAQNSLHEATLLSLDSTKSKTILGWKPQLNLDEALYYTTHWYKHYSTQDVYELCLKQMTAYCNLINLSQEKKL